MGGGGGVWQMLTSSGGSLNADRGVKFAKILLTSYVNAPLGERAKLLVTTLEF